MTNITPPPVPHLQALLEAQKKIEAVGKDGKNPYFKSDYATLNATIDACKAILNDSGFIVLQPIESDEHGVYVCTTLLHVSGEVITSRMKIEQAKSNDPQAQGSAITYARRYALKSLLTMMDEDDDGEQAMARASKPASHLSMPCKIHNVPMKEFVSKKTGEPYFAHQVDEGVWCYGKANNQERLRYQSANLTGDGADDF